MEAFLSAPELAEAEETGIKTEEMKTNNNIEKSLRIWLHYNAIPNPVQIGREYRFCL